MTFKEWIKYLFYTTFYEGPLLRRRLCSTCMHDSCWKHEAPCNECDNLHNKYKRDWQKWGKRNNLILDTFKVLFIVAAILFIIVTWSMAVVLISEM